jgi:hypothetical protein
MGARKRRHEPEQVDIGKKLKQLFQGCEKDHLTVPKERALLMVALACVCRCPHCTQDRIQQALDVGATKDEVAEVLLAALYWVEQFHEKPPRADTEAVRDRPTGAPLHPQGRGPSVGPSPELPPGYLSPAMGCIL